MEPVYPEGKFKTTAGDTCLYSGKYKGLRQSKGLGCSGNLRTDAQSCILKGKL
jgi:hypothetical protein